MLPEPIKIVAIDDDQTILDIYEVGLGVMGYDVKTFLNPVKGRDYILSDTLPDIILVDIMLPDIDGMTLIKEFRSNPKTSHIPIIAVSGLSDAKTLKTALAAGALNYVVKPFNIDDLAAKINTACAGRKRV